MYRLTDFEKETLTRRLQHFLLDHMHKNGVEKDILAEEMNVGIAEVETMLSNSTYQPLVDAIEILTTLASLKKKFGQQPPDDLLDWLLRTKNSLETTQSEIEGCIRRKGHPVTTVANVADPDEARKKLWKWESDLLSFFDPISIILRKRFHAFCEEDRRNGSVKLKEWLASAVGEDETLKEA